MILCLWVSNVTSCTQINTNIYDLNKHSETAENTLTQNELIDSENCTETCTENIQSNSPILNKPMLTTNSAPIRLNKKES